MEELHVVKAAAAVDALFVWSTKRRAGFVVAVPQVLKVINNKKIK